MSVAIDSIKVYINQFIHNFDYVDAVFLAERLYAEGNWPSFELFLLLSRTSFLLVKNDESTYLLARTYYLSGDVNKSYWLLRNSSIEHMPVAKLLLAKCCFDTDKYVALFVVELMIFYRGFQIAWSWISTYWKLLIDKYTGIRWLRRWS